MNGFTLLMLVLTIVFGLVTIFLVPSLDSGDNTAKDANERAVVLAKELVTENASIEADRFGMYLFIAALYSFLLLPVMAFTCVTSQVGIPVVGYIVLVLSSTKLLGLLRPLVVGKTVTVVTVEKKFVQGVVLKSKPPQAGQFPEFNFIEDEFEGYYAERLIDKIQLAEVRTKDGSKAVGVIVTKNRPMKEGKAIVALKTAYQLIPIAYFCYIFFSATGLFKG